MKFLTARFIGADGSLGYKRNNIYLLIFKELGFWSSLWNGFSIEIWRANKENIKDINTMLSSATGYCPYKSMTTFLLNWEILPQKELKVVLEDQANIIPAFTRYRQ